jgi:TraX protein
VDPNTGSSSTRNIRGLDGHGSGTIESFKWLGLIVMFAEHWMRYVVGELPEWLYLCGRVAFPLFVSALALGLRRLPDARLQLVALRLCLWALVAQASLQLVDAPEGQLNVLFTLGLGVAVVLGFERIRSPFVLALVLCAAGAVALWCEFGIIGTALVAAAVALTREEDPSALAWIAVGGLLAALALPNRNHFALAAIPIGVLVWWLGFEVPRVRRIFYWAYALQFPVYAGARLLLP